MESQLNTPFDVHLLACITHVRMKQIYPAHCITCQDEGYGWGWTTQGIGGGAAKEGNLYDRFQTRSH